MFLTKFFKKSNAEDEEELTNNTFSLKKENDKKERRKRKKEPPRPWTKKERYILLSIILFTSLTSAALGLSARAWKLPGLPRITLPKVNLEEKYVITKKPEPTKKYDDVLNQIRNITKDLSGVYGVYVLHLDGSGSYGIYEEEIFTAASLIKLPVLVSLYKEAEEGRISLDKKYALKDSDKIVGAGSLYSKPVGTILTFRELAKLMGKESDNTAFGIVRTILGDEKINQVISKFGLTRTSLEENTTSPKDMGAIFYELYKSKYLTKDHSEVILNYLTDTVYESWLPAGISDDVRVAHKFGREVHVVNDAGIIFAKKPFILVIMSKGVVEKEADEVIPKLSKIIYEYELANQ